MAVPASKRKNRSLRPSPASVPNHMIKRNEAPRPASMGLRAMRQKLGKGGVAQKPPADTEHLYKCMQPECVAYDGQRQRQDEKPAANGHYPCQSLDSAHIEYPPGERRAHHGDNAKCHVYKKLRAHGRHGIEYDLEQPVHQIKDKRRSQSGGDNGAAFFLSSSGPMWCMGWTKESRTPSILPNPRRQHSAINAMLDR